MDNQRRICVTAILFLIFGLAPATLSAQGFGIRGGVQQTQIITDIDENTLGTETGLTLGAFFMVPLPKSFGIYVEGLYAQKIVTQQNLDVIQSGGPLDPDASLELGYIEIPVTLAYRFSPSNNLQPRLYGGPVIGVIVNESVDLKGKEIGDIATEASLLTKEAFNERELGWIAGAGVSLDLSAISLTFDLRYSAGIGTVRDDFDGGALGREIDLGAFTGLIGIGF